MRLFSIVLILVLIGAIVAPMYIEGPNGRPLMAPDKLIYRWQDEFGVWQFGEDAPAGVDAEQMHVDPEASMTLMGDEWNMADDEPTQPGAQPPQFTISSPLDVYKSAPQLIEAAKRVASQMSERTEQLDASLR